MDAIQFLRGMSKFYNNYSEKDPDCKTDMNYEEIYHFIIKLGEAAHSYGASDEHIESFIIAASVTYGIKGKYSSSPADHTFSFMREGCEWKIFQRNKLAITNNDTNRLDSFEELLGCIIMGELNISEALPFLE